MRRTRRTLRRIFGVTLATFVALTSGPLPVLSDQPRQPLALLGFNLPTLASDLSYFSAANLSDIKNALHADFVRTGWAPNWMPHQPRLKQRLTDAEIHGICGAGLKLMIIVPGKTHDKAGLAYLEDSIAWFFQRYTQREPGCIRWAEIANEADLPVNGFADVRDYAS